MFMPAMKNQGSHLSFQIVITIMLRYYYTQLFTVGNNRNFHASNKEPRSGKFDGTGFKTD